MIGTSSRAASANILPLTLNARTSGPNGVLSLALCFLRQYSRNCAKSIEEVGVLYQAFEQVSAEFGPILSALSEVEMEAWLEKLAKGADSVSPFWRLSSGQKNELLMYSASQLLSLRKDKVLLGMPVEQDTSSE